MSLDSLRKLEHPKETHADRGRTYKLHTDRPLAEGKAGLNKEHAVR